MFYSQTVLARKGPLGTVWIAAHLQNKLKKSEYLSTNVASTVERIMYPEVPIALRMLGHLLLGVVRIYSKQIDYLYEDYNGIQLSINRILTSTSVDLPAGATKVPVDDVTLPEKFDLVSLDLDDYFENRLEDAPIKTWEEITLTDQMPTGIDPYVIINIDEHDQVVPEFVRDNLGDGPVPMEEDVPPSDAGFGTPPSRLGSDALNSRIRSPLELPSIEVMRDAEHDFDFNISPILPDRAAPDEFLMQEINRDNTTYTKTAEDILSPVERFSPPHIHEEPPCSVHLDSFVRLSPDELEVQRTPIVGQPRVKRRKRKQPFDNSLVLTNKYIQDGLQDTTDICRDRNNCPSSSLGIWKLNKSLQLRKDGGFIMSFVTGACADLSGLYMNNAIPARFHLIPSDAMHQYPTIAQPPPSMHDGDDVEIEYLRNNKFPSPDRNMPPFSTVVPSSKAQSYFTPEKPRTGLQLECLETAEENGKSRTGGVGAANQNLHSLESFSGRGFQEEHTVLSDIPEMLPSPRELEFLEPGNCSPPGSLGTPEVGIFSKNQATPQLKSLSSRTRAVAQYLRKQSSATPVSNKSSGGLSLNKILDGKPRNITARMFYEILALKSLGLIDVHQENPYDDITLQVDYYVLHVAIGVLPFLSYIERKYSACQVLPGWDPFDVAQKPFPMKDVILKIEMPC